MGREKYVLVWFLPLSQWSTEEHLRIHYGRISGQSSRRMGSVRRSLSIRCSLQRQVAKFSLHLLNSMTPPSQWQKCFPLIAVCSSEDCLFVLLNNGKIRTSLLSLINIPNGKRIFSASFPPLFFSSTERNVAYLGKHQTKSLQGLRLWSRSFGCIIKTSPARLWIGGFVGSPLERDWPWAAWFFWRRSQWGHIPDTPTKSVPQPPQIKHRTNCLPDEVTMRDDELELFFWARQLPFINNPVKIRWTVPCRSICNLFLNSSKKTN